MTKDRAYPVMLAQSVLTVVTAINVISRGMDQLACAENLANNIHSPVSTFPFILVTVNAGVSLHVLHSFIYDLFIQQMEQLQT